MPNHSLKISPKKYTLRHWQITHGRYKAWRQSETRTHTASASIMTGVRRFNSLASYWSLLFESRWRGNLPRHHLCVTELYINNNHRAQNTHWNKLSAISAFRPPSITRTRLTLCFAQCWMEQISFRSVKPAVQPVSFLRDSFSVSFSESWSVWFLLFLAWNGRILILAA